MIDLFLLGFICVNLVVALFCFYTLFDKYGNIGGLLLAFAVVIMVIGFMQEVLGGTIIGVVN